MLTALPSEAELSSYRCIIDALFGFSFKGAVRPPFVEVMSVRPALRLFWVEE